MNIKFEIYKVSENTYKYKLHYISEKLKKKLDCNVISIDFQRKKILRTNTWPSAFINNTRFSFYFYHNVEVSIESNRTNSYLNLNYNNNEYEIETDIKDFDKIVIKGFKILSDTLNEAS